ncbi:MAG: sulfatase [Planctomycetota bacterium]
MIKWTTAYAFVWVFAFAVAAQPNVLFIAVDDLRPAMRCYGVKQAITPHMDQLAATGRLFNNHFVQVPTCGASCHSMLTSRYPRKRSEIRNVISGTLMGVESESARSMPELFRKNGYTTVCIGKITHSSDGKKNGQSELPDAWDEMITPYGPWANFPTRLLHAYTEGRVKPYGAERNKGDEVYEPLYEFPEVGDSELPDGMLADTAIQRLGQFADSGQPFFMGVGFYKPHMPFVAPKKYKDLYDGVAFPSLYGMKRGDTRRIGQSNELWSYDTPFERPVGRQPISEEDAQEVRWAYHACVTYADAQIGRVLQALEDTGLASNTIVVLWGDHGWHLGEHNAWAKHTPMNYSLRSSFIVRTPDQKLPGIPTESLAASLDIYPTLIDLCSLEERQTYLPLEGVSLKPVLLDPSAKARDEVLSFWFATSLNDGRYHLIVSENNGELQHDLYDLRNDPGELKNIAAVNPGTVERLMEQLARVYPQITLNMSE